MVYDTPILLTGNLNIDGIFITSNQLEFIIYVYYLQSYRVSPSTSHVHLYRILFTAECLALSVLYTYYI